jgi:hypothetical protein
MFLLNYQTQIYNKTFYIYLTYKTKISYTFNEKENSYQKK